MGNKQWGQKAIKSKRLQQVCALHEIDPFTAAVVRMIILFFQRCSATLSAIVGKKVAHYKAPVYHCYEVGDYLLILDFVLDSC